MPVVTLNGWQEFLWNFPEAHILQSGEWGELKSSFGWQPVRIVANEGGAQILFRRLLLGMTLAYIPRGPIGRLTQEFWYEVDRACHHKRAIFLKIELDELESSGNTNMLNALNIQGFQRSPHNIQPPRTIIIDLKGREEEILARMKQKCRYNIRLAEKKCVKILAWDDLTTFHHMMMATANRDGFSVHSLEYYQRVYDLFHPSGACELLLAEFGSKPLAAIMIFASGKRSWYMFGASTEDERNRMPAYLLQWEAIRWARSKGCIAYDLWGVPDKDEGTLETQFSERSDGLWRVYRFKRGFGGVLRRSLQAQDKVFYPSLYKLYLWRVGVRGVSDA
jgi:lipid II:glycine glycyltransferase (peptidoglycan interpeptide bridge formation enzyme)